MRTSFEIIGYNVKAIIQGGKYFHQCAVSFIAEKDGVSFPLKTRLDNELIRDMYCVMGLDPVKELENIAIMEITEELNEREKK